MATRKSVDQILDGAADILEKHGWVTQTCYDSKLGGFCALGAIAKAVYPKMSNRDIEDVAYPISRRNDARPAAGAPDPRHVEAVEFFGKRVARDPLWGISDSDVYIFNDQYEDGIEYVDETDQRCVVNEKVRLHASRMVVTRLRNAAKAYRRQQAKAAA